MGRASSIPRDVQLQSAMQRLAESIKGVDPSPDLSRVNTMKHLEHFRFNEKWKKDHKPLRKTRNWRGGN